MSSEAIYNNYELICNAVRGLGDSPNSMDGDPNLCNLVYELYSINGSEGYQLSNPPTDLQIKTLAGAVNRIMAYFKGNAPTQANNPAAYSLYEALTQTYIPNGSTNESIANLFADVAGSDPTKSAAAIAALQSGAGSAFIEGTLSYEANNFVHNPNVASYPNYNKGDTTIQGDVTTLQTDLAKYNADIQSGASQATIDRDLVRIAADITNYNSDCAVTPGGEKDGALFCLTDMLGSSSDAASLLATATALNGAPTNAQALANLQNALAAAGEKGSGGSLSGMLNYMEWCEGW